jgi:predicted anti-sigma-YlaC factor YlaD
MARQAEHQRVEDLISAYLDQQVTAEERQFFERHIAACANCRAQLDATRSMVAALRAMPSVKAPRSFVLPREMAKQPKRSIFAWYPTLRLATALAAIAFVVLFAGDLLISQAGSGAAPRLSVPAAAPAPLMEKPAEVMKAPAATQAVQPAPTRPPAAGASNAVATEPGVAASAPPAGTAAKAAPTETAITVDAMSATVAMPTATPEMTAVPKVAMAPSPAPEATSEAATETQVERSAEPAVEQPVATAAMAPAAPTIEPIRVIELALLGLVIVLGAAMLIARRKQA